MPGAVVVEAGLRVELAAREAVILQDGGDRLLPLPEGVVDIARNDRVGRLLRDRDDRALMVRLLVQTAICPGIPDNGHAYHQVALV
jgi:hypothetical protein